MLQYAENEGDEGMKRTRFRIITLGILLCMIVVSFTSTVVAEPSLQWHTQNVYYDAQGSMIIEGYFSNNGTRIVTKVNWLDLKVYFRRWYINWWLQDEHVFKDFDVNLLPGETSGWTLRILNAGYTQFDYWEVVYDLNFSYI